jgi:hypothetical protein
MRSAIGVVVLAGALALSQGEAPFDPAARAKALAPAIEEETFALARIDVARADLGAFLKALAPLLPSHKGQLEEIGGRVAEFRPAFLKAGGGEMIVSLSTADVPPVSFVYVPLKAGADVPGMTRLLNKLLAPWGAAEQRGDALVAGPRAALDRLAKGAPSSRPELLPAVTAAGDTAVQVLLLPTNDQRKVISEMGQFTDLGASGKQLVRGVRWGALGANLGPKPSAKLTLRAGDPDAAKAMADLLITANLKRLGKTKFIGHEKTLQELASKEFAAVARALTPKIKDNEVTVQVGEPEAFAAFAGLLRTMAEEGGPPGPESAQMKQLIIALHNYSDTYGSFPAHAVYSKDGKPLLSWRVAILPFVDQGELFKEFKLDEPWDSPHNKKLIDKMPKVYRSPRIRDPRPGLTTYLAPVHPEAAFTGKKDGLRLADFLDGTSNTIALVDASDAAGVVWTKPDDLKVEKNDPWKGLLGHYPGFVLVAMADASVGRVEKGRAAKELWALFTRDGGEVVPGLAK